MAQETPENSVEPLERQSLVDRLTARLGEAILAGRYDRGATLPPERDLARSLQVNRTSLKHALQRLEQLGFISTRHGIGSVVLDPTETAGARLLSYLVFRTSGIDTAVLSDLIEARTLLGAFLTRLAAERRAEEDVRRLTQVLADLDAVGDDPDEVQRIELVFFRNIMRATKNQIFVTLAGSMFAVYLGRAHVFRDAFTDRAGVRRALGRVLEAVEAKDAESAEKAAHDYLKKNGKALLEAAKREA
ncbi:MAG: FadR family transcriptional regulator [Myxococcales bacterium]|nr:FadR family transcriptional regulator [Myxococcales bacterium]